MARMLMATWDGAGNFPPERALVRGLVARGHQVSVLAHDSQRASVEADGAVFRPYTGAVQVNADVRGMDDTLFKDVLFSEPLAAAVAATIEQAKPDLLLIDALLFTAMGVANSSGVPTVALGSTVHSFLVGKPFQPLVEAAGLALTFSYRAFELGADYPANVVHVGPLRPLDQAAQPFQRRHPAKPLMVASLSTSHQDQEALLQRLCDALAGLDVEAVVTTGRGIDPSSLTAAENTTLIRHLNHDAVLAEADLLITHAGHGTVMAGATTGVPMLCLPMGRDQHGVAASVAALGLGAVLDQDASIAELRSAINGLLADADQKARSRAFAEAQPSDQARLDKAVTLVEALLPHG